MNDERKTRDGAPPDWDPVELFVFACWGDSWISRLIRHVTGGPSHVGVGWRFVSPVVQDTIRRSRLVFDGVWYSEALFGRTIGPARRWKRVVEWALKGPTRRIDERKVALDRAAAVRCWRRAQLFVGRRSYGEWQLFFMWLHARVGTRVPSSPLKFVCSEYVARVLFPELDLRGDREMDELTPRDVWEALK